MVKMVSVKMSTADKKAQSDADGTPNGGYRPNGPDGIEVRIEPEHAKKMGLEHPLPVGHKIDLSGEGEVAESHADERGHRLTIRLNRAGVTHEAPQGGGLRDEIKDNMGKSEAKAADRQAAKVAAKGNVGDKLGEAAD